ncbi:hypothetical protein MNBD_GAMMA01-1385 [hydrothermal vent metagenome]|uniref:Toxin n=1 Tax=hydrothermal vent metagenome TaxID=652676 RepID=A0A3B0VIA1_9ZZZZ
MSYKLSKRAEADFRKIYKYTYREFGEEKADKYTDSLEECFLLISENSRMGRSAGNLSKDLFRHEHQEHIIFYRRKSDYVFIVRMRHKREDV